MNLRSVEKAPEIGGTTPAVERVMRVGDQAKPPLGGEDFEGRRTLSGLSRARPSP